MFADKPLKAAFPMYENKCDVLHMDISVPRTVVPKLANNYLVSSEFGTIALELFPVPGLGIKYVPEGVETYRIKGKKYEVTGRKYLIVNDSILKFEGSAKGCGNRGMGVNIAPEVLNDLLFQVLCPNNLDDMHQVARYFLTPELLVRETQANDELQQFMNWLHRLTSTNQIASPPIELIYEVASVLVRENLDMISSYYKLQATKQSTRQELFHRLLRGKEMLDDSVFSEVSIGQVASGCCLSEFRFYRLFRQCFGVSPYNYLFKRRIEKGLELKQQNLSWNEIAHRLNFTDLAAFSKGFKKVTGKAPTQFHLNG